MLLSFRQLFNQNQIKKCFEKARLNNKKQILKLDKLKPLQKYLRNPDRMFQLLNQLIPKLQSPQTVLRLKTRIVIHHFLIETFNEDVKSIILDRLKANFQNLVLKSPRKNPNTLELQMHSQKYVQEFIEKRIISHYQLYLQKLCFKQQAFIFAKNFIPNAEKKQSMVEIINHGFQIINICQMILNTQQAFNKMGRYYIDHQEMISLFVMYLEDLNVYNTFIKNIARILVRCPEQNSNQEIKHNFLFLTESQKTSDRLAQFFFNRYYYSQIQIMFKMPKFMTINAQSFDKVRKSAKKIDNVMVKMVKRSSQSCSSWKNKSDFDRLRQADMSQSLNNSIQLDILAKTLGGYPLMNLKKVQSSPGNLNHFSKVKLPDLQFLEQDQQQDHVEQQQQQDYNNVSKQLQKEVWANPESLEEPEYLDLRQTDKGLIES